MSKIPLLAKYIFYAFCSLNILLIIKCTPGIRHDAKFSRISWADDTFLRIGRGYYNSVSHLLIRFYLHPENASDIPLMICMPAAHNPQ